MTPFKGRNRITQGWSNKHYGLDIVGDDDPAVRSVCDGTVATSTIITSKTDKTWEWGNYVRVDGDDGLKYYYCHLNRREVRSGQRVEAGAPLGIMGNTGKSFGAHLHLQIRDKAGREVNVPQAICLPNKLGTYDEDAAYVPQTKLFKLSVGPLSKGDRASFDALANKLAVPCAVDTNGCKTGLCMCTIGPVSKGDMAQVEALADKLLVPCGVM